MAELDDKNENLTEPQTDSDKKTKKAKKEKAQKAKNERPKKSKNVKNTLNLCQKERSTISGATFVLALAIILAVLVGIEYVGVYRPYKDLEALQAQIAQQQSDLDDLNNSMSDMNKVRDDYNRYNYEGFDTSIVDRNRIFELLDTVIFEKYPTAKVGTLSLNKNVLTFPLTGLNLNQINGLVADFFEHGIVEDCYHTRTGSDKDGNPTADITIVFKVQTGGNN